MPKTSANYGHNYILEKYLKLPRWLLVPTTIQHGWYSVIHPADLESTRGERIYLAWSQRIASGAAGKTPKKTLVLSAPFVLYRKMQKIELSHNARGTIVFPQHSSLNIPVDYDIDKYCEELKQLPKEYHPLTVCLHWVDEAKLTKAYQKHGFSVVCSGNSRQPKDAFVKKFYEILSQHKFATSNDIGSYAFYAIEMGIPFFILGNPPKFMNSDKVSELRVTPEEVRQTGKAISVFSKQFKSITSIQTKYVNAELGLDDAMSCDELRKVYIKYGIIHQIILAPARPFMALWRRILRKSRSHKFS